METAAQYQHDDDLADFHARTFTLEGASRRVFVSGSGPGVIVLPNVTIGRGAVVSAGSVVNHSVPPHTLVQGNPARPIAHCGASLGGGQSYEQFLRQLTPIKD